MARTAGCQRSPIARGSGRVITRDDCVAQLSGATFSILDSSGVGNHLRWRVTASDASGNTSLVTCETQIVRPPT